MKFIPGILRRAFEILPPPMAIEEVQDKLVSASRDLSPELVHSLGYYRQSGKFQNWEAAQTGDNLFLVHTEAASSDATLYMRLWPRDAVDSISSSDAELVFSDKTVLNYFRNDEGLVAAAIKCLSAFGDNPGAVEISYTIQKEYDKPRPGLAYRRPSRSPGLGGGSDSVGDCGDGSCGSD